ncbi:MAG: RNA-binding transcriptional accessory protein [Kiritimatiellae bacterium]|nr:RNA-binding transcriptional accessory protein [Kiritimatiellia bacterium]
MPETQSEEAELVSIPKLVEELGISPRQIAAVARLLAEGNTIPFIARYRKEVHGNLDEVQIGRIQERLAYHRELDERRQTILKSISDQGKLTDALKAKILAATTKSALEDLYLPFRPKRRTRAMIAKERGLEPLADLIESQPDGNPDTDAAKFVDPEKEVPDVAAALAGARDIVAERISEDADIRGFVRSAYERDGKVVSSVVDPPPSEPTKFEQYYEFDEPVATIPSHRYLAIRRGQTEGVLRVRLEVEQEPLLEEIRRRRGVRAGTPYGMQLKSAVEDAFRRLIAPSVEVDVSVEMKLKADRAAVEVFADNLRNLLLAPPLGSKRIIGIDPGLRTGCKCAALDATGKFLDTITVYLAQSDRSRTEAKIDLLRFIQKHRPEAIAVGNGTGGRETEAFVREALKQAHMTGIIVVSVSEAGASVYSASDVAREEFPDLDLTIRGAISIGRRLIDPLAELVKIDPKAIGVGQYQHDVFQPMLSDKLGEVVESCVNKVGVELNTASAPLLARVSGVGPAMAKRIVAYRDEHGAFQSRRALLDVPTLGPKTFEQAAGFLRIHDAANPLDGSAVHPERYALVERMAADIGADVRSLIGNTTLVDGIRIANYISGDVGEPTLRDILAELKKPGRDPRASFEMPKFLDDVTAIEDVKPGMKIEGVVTNVAAFGAFVDIGVHQDGLVHVSQLSDRFVRDPAEVVKVGQKLKVTVIEVDIARKRISLSARSNPEIGPRPPRGGDRPGGGQRRFERETDRHGGQVWRSGPSGFSSNPFSGL